MKYNQISLPLIAISLSFLSQSQASIINYAVSGYVDASGTAGVGAPIFNTSTDVLGSGTTANFLDVTGSPYVDFTIKDGDDNSPDPVVLAHLRVTLSDISSGTQVMLAQTSDSQGLEDTGTISLLIGGSAGSQSNSATITFDWYTPNGLFDTSLSNQYTITSYDIDFNQFNSMRTTDIETVFLSDTIGAVASNLTVSADGSFTRVADEDPSTDADFADAENAVVFRTVEGSQQQIKVGKIGNASGNQLYMFEFRNPPGSVDVEISPIPEPTSIALLSLGGFALIMRRRR